MNLRLTSLTGLLLAACGPLDPVELATDQQQLVSPTTAAGRSPTHFDVSNSGSANFRIPLLTPPGLGELKPDLALSYDSRAGNGLFGMGWSLTGTSVITRCPATIASNGAPRAVTMTTVDRFCLDGEQLKLKSGTYAANGSTYATELDGFAHVVAVGQSGAAGPASFTVSRKNGLTYRYGTNGNFWPNKMSTSGSSPIRSWLLSEIIDRSGNSVALTWVTDTSEVAKLQRIDYPKTATGQGPFYAITVGYETRTDSMIGYNAGATHSLSSRASSITMAAADGTVIKRYALTYEYGTTTGRSRLTAVQECSATTCLEPTRVTYSERGPAFGAANNTASAASSLGCGPYVIDLNDDGRSDLLWAPYKDGATLNCAWRARLSTGDGFGADIVLTGMVTEGAIHQVSSGRFLGNSKTQLILPIPDQATGADPVLHAVTYDRLRGFSKTSLGIAAGRARSSPFLQAATDYNGDGLTDLVFVENSNGGRVFVRLNVTTPNGAATFTAPQKIFESTESVSGGLMKFPDTSATLTSPGAVLAGDFNGDGMSDLLVRTRRLSSNLGIYCAGVLFSKGANGQLVTAPDAPIMRELTRITAGPGDLMPNLLLLDWNGDGLMDYQFDNRVWVTKGQGDLEYTLATTTSRSFKTASVPIDYDGDGKTDILVRDNGEMKLLKSNGTAGLALAPTGIHLNNDNASSAFPIDLDGDGLLELGWARSPTSSSQPLPRLYLRSARKLGEPLADIATQFTDGLGLAYQVGYDSLSNGASYSIGSTAVFPEQDVLSPLYVVSGVKQVLTNESRTISTQTFSYYGARYHAHGRGFEGFRRKTMQGTLFEEEEYAQTYPYTGMVTSIRNFNTKWSGTPKAVVTGGENFERRFFRFASPVVVEQSDIIGSVKAGKLISRETTDTTYDTSGNATLTAVTTEDLDAVSPASPFLGKTWKRTTERTMSVSTANWCLGLPSKETVKFEAPDQPSLTRTTTFEPDLVKCRLTKRVEEPDTLPLKTTHEFGYDDCGNLSSVKVTGHDPDGSELSPRTTTHSYGTRCQFAEASTNALSQTSSAVFDTRFGVATSRTDPNGLTTSFTVDHYGRVTRERRPDGTSTVKVHTTCSSGAACWSEKLYRSSIKLEGYSSSGTLVTESWADFDAFERPVRKRSKHVLSTDVVTTDSLVTYDSLGRPERVDRPFRGSEKNGYTRTTYDEASRPIIEELVRGDDTVARTKKFTYLGRTTQVEDSKGHVTTMVNDVRGHVRRVIDPLPGGTTLSDYDAQGRLTQTTDANGTVSTTKSNLLGNTTENDDANRGLTTLAVDSLGQVVSSTNAKGQTTSFVHDALGRKTSQTAPEGTTTWSWGASATEKNIGQLKSVLAAGAREAFTYDSIGRLSNHSITEQSETFTFTYTYNDQGLVDLLSYPTSPLPTSARFTLKHSYSQGELAKLADATTTTAQTLWELTSESASGATTEKLGRATPVTLTTGVSALTGAITAIQAGVATSTTNRLNLSYTWDDEGNLASRSDVTRSLLETFEVDALNRLTGSKLNGTTNLTMTYDAAGNVRTRSDVGTYSYADSSHPNAVTSAGGTSYAYDANGNVSSKAGATQSWASFDLPTVLRSSTATSTFTYGPSRELLKQVATSSEGTETTTYVGGRLERVAPSSGSAQWRHVVPTPSGHSVIVTRSSTGIKTYAVLGDHLGSTSAIIDGDTGTTLASLSFNAFGARRSASSWSGAISSSERTTLASTTRDGFAGHVQLDNLGLVHMRGRVYDPTIGRFMSVDPVAVLGISQALNPYSYVRNQPLTLTDPTGLLDSGFGYSPPPVSLVGGITWSYDPGLPSYNFLTLDPSGLRLDATFNNLPTDGMGQSLGALDGFLAGYFREGGWGQAPSTILDLPAARVEQPGFEVGWRVDNLRRSVITTLSELLDLVTVPECRQGGCNAGTAPTAPLRLEMLRSSVNYNRGLIDGTASLGEREFMVSGRFVAGGNRLCITSACLFPIDGSTSKGSAGIRDMLELMRASGSWARGQGFDQLELSYYRLGPDEKGTSKHGGMSFHWRIDTSTGQITDLLKKR